MGARKLAAMASPFYSQDSFVGIPWKVDIVTFILNSGVILGAVSFPPCAVASLTSKSHVLQDDKTPHIFFHRLILTQDGDKVYSSGTTASPLLPSESPLPSVTVS